MTTQNNQTNIPKIRHYSWLALVQQSWGGEWTKRDIAYEFSDGRKFEDSGAHSGIYDPEN